MRERREELHPGQADAIPPAWEETIAACLEKDPAKRPQSIREMADRLTGGGVPAPAAASEPSKEVSNPPPVARPSRRALPIFATAVVLLALVGGAGWYFGMHLPGERARLAGIARQETEARSKQAAEKGAEQQRVAAAEAERRRVEKNEVAKAEQLRIENENAAVVAAAVGEQAQAAEKDRMAGAKRELIAQTLSAARDAGRDGDWNRMESLIENVLSLESENPEAFQLRKEMDAAKQRRVATPTPNPTSAGRAVASSLWLFPDSDRRYLQSEEVARLSRNNLWQARNEIYVRRGYIFSTEQGRKFARSFGNAYEPRISSDAAISRLFNAFETANLELIRKYENAR